jgi:hypothetical protein
MNKYQWPMKASLIVLAALLCSISSTSFSDTTGNLGVIMPAQKSQQAAPLSKPVPVQKQAPIQKPARVPMTISILDDLVVERIWLDNNCQINISLLNRNRQRSNTIFSNLLVRVDYGETKELSVSRLDPRGSLAGPGGRVAFNTRITLKAPANVRVIADSRNVIREHNENNNQKSTRLTPQCVKAGVSRDLTQTRKPQTAPIKAAPTMPALQPIPAPKLTPRNLSTAPKQVQLPQQGLKPQVQTAPTVKSQPFGSKAQTQKTPLLSAQTKPLGTLSVPSGIKPTITKAGPQITSLLNVPLGALKPGSRVYVKGKGFGPRPGKILMSGNYPGSPIELAEVNWKSDTNVSGVVPMYMDGQVNQTVSIQIQISDNTRSNPMNTGFQGRLEAFCDRHLIYVSDGSAIDCTPNICFYDVVGTPQCSRRCGSAAECAPRYRCSSDGYCILGEMYK